MRKTITAAIAATLIATFFSPANAGMSGLGGAKAAAPASETLIQKTRGRNFWLGVGLGVATTAVIVGSARASARRHARRCTAF